MEERLQKILSQAGFGSRRGCEELIVGKRVRVNGEVAQIGQKAEASQDDITVDGIAIPKAVEKIYIALHKPRGILSEVAPKSDPRPTVRDLVPQVGHLFCVGRLDYDSEGLILLTNDGELTNRLTHPRYGHEKEYLVLIGRTPDDEQLAALKHGVVLEDGYRTAPAQVRVESRNPKETWLRIVLREGRKRQIREMGERIGLPVQRILRVRIGTLVLGDLKPRDWRNLTKQEVNALTAGSTSVRPERRSAAPRRRISANRSGPSNHSTRSDAKPRTGVNRKPESGGLRRSNTPRKTGKS